MRTLSDGRLFVAGLFLTLVTSSPAQIFRITGGASSGYQAQGFGVEVRGKNYEAWSGVGVVDGKLQYGANLKMLRSGYTFVAGNDSVPLTLPIDIFGTQATLQIMGVSAGKQYKKTKVYFFAGKMGSTYSSPMFRTGSGSGPLNGLIFVNHQLTPNLRLYSKNIFSTAQTSLNGVEWRSCATLSSWLATRPILRHIIDDQHYGCTLSFAAGIGSNHPYSSESFSLVQPRINLNLGYANATGFQRVITGAALQSELNGFNVSGSLQPSKSVGLSFAHQNYLVPQTNLPTVQLSVERVSGSWMGSQGNGPSMGFAFFRSTMSSNTSSGASLWASQSIGAVDLRGNYLISASKKDAASQSISLTTQEKLGPRLSALQISSYSAGHINVAFGGGLLTNRMTVAVNYQTLYVPLRPDHPFTQALAVSVNLHLHGNIHLTTATSFAPNGKMLYTLAGSESFYRMAGLQAAPAMENFRLQPYVIQGDVKTPEGVLVSGAAIRVGKEIVYSDRDGHFFARERKAGSYPIEVVLDAFLADGNYAVVEAPAHMEAVKEGSDAGIVIVVVRR